MPGQEQTLPGEVPSITERRKAQVLLLGLCTMSLGLPFAVLVEGEPLHWLGVALMFASLALLARRPHESEYILLPRHFRRLARLAGLPELGTTVLVYTIVIGGFTSSLMGFVIEIITT